MPKIGKENIDSIDLDFKCPRCSTECTKVDVYEPEMYYISKADGSLVGPLCQECANVIPSRELVIKKIPLSAFLVIIHPNGEGVNITEQGIETLYERSATPYEIKSACNNIVEDLQAAENSAKLVRLLGSVNKKSDKLVLPSCSGQ